MNPYIIAKLKEFKNRYEEIQSLLIDPVVISNRKRFLTLSNEYTQINEAIICFQKWKKVLEDIRITTQMLEDPEMCDMVQDELKNFKNYQKQLEQQLQLFIIPIDPDDECSCFLEVRAGTGGNEASLFAKDLFRMYYRYSEIHDWKLQVISVSDGEYGGYKEIISKISNKGAYGKLKFESGGHRVQRIPETESQGRIHTSTCTVAVFPEIENAELSEINSADLRIDTYRSSGAGGQHVNTTDSAIRITHVPTGLMVECQDERSQHKNKIKALSVLNARLRAIEIRRRQEEESSIRRNLLGSGDRSDRIRTYNFPKKRVTDHRIGLTLYRLDEIISGNLDMMIQPIMQQYRDNQLTNISKII